MSSLIGVVVVPVLLAFALGLGVGWFAWRWRQPRVVVSETWTVERLARGDEVVAPSATPRLRLRVDELEHELAEAKARAAEIEQVIARTRRDSGLGSTRVCAPGGPASL